MRANWLTLREGVPILTASLRAPIYRFVLHQQALWQVNRVDDEQLVMSQRQATRLLDMRPSSIFYWRQSGKLGPAPWTLKELLAVKHRADAPPRRRGVKAAHGTPSRVGAGCNYPDCRASSAAIQRERERVEAERQFTPEMRAALLDLLGQGVPFKQSP
jgi:hypothetical protein